MEKKGIRVSVIIPVYNGETFLAQSIESVFHQGYRPYEVIVVDDGSTDGTKGIVDAFKGGIRYIFQKNRGPAAARNRGLKSASGDVIAFLDSDDAWPGNKLEIQVGCLMDNPDIEVLLGGIELLGAGEVLPSPSERIHYGINLGCALIKRSAFEKVGYFDEELTYSEDHDWFLRAKEIGIEMAIKPKTTLYYRRHPDSITRRADPRNYQLPHILKNSIDRRRNAKHGSTEILPRLSDLRKL
jgi:glycosyltransferase involved in cell wall biosynthesis